MNMTTHAATRLQQRGIPLDAVDAILSYGRRRRRHGADVYFLDKKSRARMANAIGKRAYLGIERSLNSYLIVGDDGTIVTAAHRLGRLKF